MSLTQRKVVKTQIAKLGAAAHLSATHGIVHVPTASCRLRKHGSYFKLPYGKVLMGNFVISLGSF